MADGGARQGDGNHELHSQNLCHCRRICMFGGARAVCGHARSGCLQREDLPPLRDERGHAARGRRGARGRALCPALGTRKRGLLLRRLVSERGSFRGAAGASRGPARGERDLFRQIRALSRAHARPRRRDPEPDRTSRQARGAPHRLSRGLQTRQERACVRGLRACRTAI